MYSCRLPPPACSGSGQGLLKTTRGLRVAGVSTFGWGRSVHRHWSHYRQDKIVPGRSASVASKPTPILRTAFRSILPLYIDVRLNHAVCDLLSTTTFADVEKLPTSAATEKGNKFVERRQTSEQFRTLAASGIMFYPLSAQSTSRPTLSNFPTLVGCEL